MISLNNPVPDFTACATGNKTLSLSDYRGHKVLLYFYPKDNTAGCTQQAQSFRDFHPQFAALNTVILGVSRDSVRTHDNFKAKHALPFELLSDSDESLCQLFAVIVQKMLYGKQVRGIERSSFLIDEQGVLIGQWRKLKVAGHSEAVIAFLENLES